MQPLASALRVLALLALDPQAGAAAQDATQDTTQDSPMPLPPGADEKPE